MEETKLLYDTIRAAAKIDPEFESHGEADPSLQNAKKTLTQAVVGIERVQNQVRQAIHDVERAQDRKH